MRRVALPASLVILATTAAHAGPFTIGAAIGREQSKIDASGNATETYGLYARLKLSSRIAAGLELSKFDDPSGFSVRTVSAIGVFDIARGGPWIPVAIVGLGYDHGDDGSSNTTDGHHVEGGLGLEYRAQNGFVIGANVRIGDRTIDSAPPLVAYPANGGGGGGPIGVAYAYNGQQLKDGEYRSFQLGLGVHF